MCTALEFIVLRFVVFRPLGFRVYGYGGLEFCRSRRI